MPLVAGDSGAINDGDELLVGVVEEVEAFIGASGAAPSVLDIRWVSGTSHIVPSSSRRYISSSAGVALRNAIDNLLPEKVCVCGRDIPPGEGNVREDDFIDIHVDGGAHALFQDTEINDTTGIAHGQHLARLLQCVATTSYPAARFNPHPPR
ncbi:MAG: hypothetical protein KC442_21520, partial [Thermomicrobiales bacterium]|nr:hypothetical protein [Thermomicrobiales bacterium]